MTQELHCFFAGQAKPEYRVEPDRLVYRAERIVHGGTTFDLLPVRGGETEDGLVVHLPERGVAVVGDVLMPYLGAPFLPEGSAEQLFETMRLVQDLAPRRLIHGHTGLTDRFPIEVFPALEAALRELHQRVLAGVRAGDMLVEILHQHVLPEALRAHPAAVVPYLVMREHVVKRIYHARTGYWKPDGEGVDVFAPDEWAAALTLLADGREEAFARSAGALLEGDAEALALRLVDLGLRGFPDSQPLRELRRRALNQLRAVHQQLNPFKFAVYSEWAKAELLPVA